MKSFKKILIYYDPSLIIMTLYLKNIQNYPNSNMQSYTLLRKVISIFRD